MSFTWRVLCAPKRWDIEGLQRSKCTEEGYGIAVWQIQHVVRRKVTQVRCKGRGYYQSTDPYTPHIAEFSSIAKGSYLLARLDARLRLVQSANDCKDISAVGQTSPNHRKEAGIDPKPTNRTTGRCLTLEILGLMAVEPEKLMTLQLYSKTITS